MSLPSEDARKEKTVLGKLSLEEFRLWNTVALKSFLAVRNKSTEGSFEELVSRAFCTWEQGVIADADAEHRERVLLNEYKEKLIIGSHTLPDPLAVKDGWLKEDDNGLTKWPSLYFSNISDYLKSKTSTELMHHLVNEYKEGKAYRYFTNKWVKEVFFHPVSETLPYCILKCRCTPSQRVSSKPYHVWVIAEKDSKDKPGGKIISAYCTCTAGLHGSCNHIAGLLFRVESAVLRGITKPTCTDRLARWTVPPAKTELCPQPVSKLIFKKDHYRTLMSIDREKQASNIKGKLSFSPLTVEQEDFVKDKARVRSDLHKLIKQHAPKCCFVELMEERKLNKKLKPPTPLSLFERAEQFTMDTSLTVQENVALFTKSITLPENEINIIKQNTVGQASSTDWYLQRQGRLTASKFHKVCTRVTSLKASASEDPSNLILSLLGYQKSPETAAMKHGKSMELHAKSVYLSKEKKKHKKFKSNEAGLAIMADRPFIGASPDLEVDCTCCKSGLVETKCPYSIRDTSPSADNLPYLEFRDGETKLRKNSNYYYQVQGQMGVTNRLYTDVFVFTSHGYVKDRINFDPSFWASMLQKLEWFWFNCLCPELLTRDLEQKQTSRDNKSSASVSNCENRKSFEVISSVCVSATVSSSSASKKQGSPLIQLEINAKQEKKKKRNIKDGSHKKSKQNPVYLCGACQDTVLDCPTQFSEDSVLCCGCPLWYQFVCVRITEDNKPKGKTKWFCTRCKP